MCGIAETLDDGVAGLVAIHESGGTALVQDPEEAQFPDLPRNAIRTGAVDGVYAASDIVAAILAWLKEPKAEVHRQASISRDEREAGMPSVFTCPDCGGTLWEVDDEAVLRFRCRTGHAYSEGTMLSLQERNLESALWAALRALEERYDLLRRVAARSRRAGDAHTSLRFERQLDNARRDIERVNHAISGLFSDTASAS